jgi:uncharacterized membrane protein
MSRVTLIRTAFFVLIALYPAIVYFGIRYLPVSFFGVLLALLLLLRSSVMASGEKRLLLPLLILHLAYSIVTAVTGSQHLLLLYPVLVNFSLCALFALSLAQDQSLLLRLVRARNIPLSEHAPSYLWRLTAVWAIFFLLSGVAAIVSGMISLEAWALYNGFIAYLLVATLMAGEWVFRGWYKRRKGV